MNLPGEQQWLRVEELDRELSLLPPDQVSARISQLAAEGEPATVLSLLSTWLALPPPLPEIKSGSVIGGRYTLVSKIGEGGMGSVWRAKQELIGRDVALKMIHPALVTPALQDRFLLEIETLGKLDHPGIIRIFDAGLHPQPNGQTVPFYAMQFVEGLPLDAWGASSLHDRTARLRLMASVCEAVHAAHERKIVHRDLKPRNVLVKPDGRPVVVDFGIARLAGIVAGDEAGGFSGTPLYAAPEQHLGRDGDFRSGESVDVYAIGAILFELLSGRPLFNFTKRASISELRRAILEDPIPRLSSILTDCPAELDDLVARSVRRDPADRFYSVAALGRAMVRIIKLERQLPAPPPWTPAVDVFIPGTQWRLVERIGEGGSGQVWVGRHDQLQEDRVFKFCDTEEKARTLKRELTLFRLLKEHVGTNPHFIQLQEVSLDEPPWYLMMDKVDAHDLQFWSEARPGGLPAIPEQVRLEIIAQAAEALQAAHEAGILHRDIKPANLLVKGTAASGVHIFIADFGIGQLASEKVLREETHLGFTRTVSSASLSGTMLYLAPEVLEGKPASARSDIYSLGVVLWQLLIGNLRAAVDAADWPAGVPDPLLREDLTRCLAGAPGKRWSSAGEFAARLRALPERRAAEARRVAELAAKARAAQRLKLLRISVGAATAVILFVAVASIAWSKARDARRVKADEAIRQAAGLKQNEITAGRKARGLALIESAFKYVADPAGARTAAASVFSLSDLVRIAPGKTKEQAVAPVNAPRQTNQTCRIVSHSGLWTAVGLDVDHLNGAVDLFQPTGQRLKTINRKDFPWVPVPEPGLLAFSPDDTFLAIGGAATSQHILLCKVPEGTLSSYLFHGSDPLCCAWHGAGRLFAVGCADGTIRIWDTEAAISPIRNSFSTNQFDLPPALDVPAQDKAARTLHGHGGPVRYVAFSGSGEWLAALDSEGYLRIYTGFNRVNPQRVAETGRTGDITPERAVPLPVFAVQTRLADVTGITGLDAVEDHLVVWRGSGAPEEFQFDPGEFFSELPLPSKLTEIAFNDQGTELCATTRTDIHWLRVSPLELLQTADGENPLGVRSGRQNDRWLIAKDHQLTDWRPEKEPSSPKTSAPPLRLNEAVAGQGSRTAIATAGDNRVAAYCGKRIQFFEGTNPAPKGTSITADGGRGAFRDMFWDRQGRLLGVVFDLPSGGLHLECWETSTNSPPTNRLSSINLDCQRIVPANDGRHCIGRGAVEGLFLFDPSSGRKQVLDSSGSARQNASIACANDGSMLAMVADRTTIQLLVMPSGKLFAELSFPRPADISALAWDAEGRHLAAAAADESDAYLQVWNLGPWLDWLRVHKLQP